MERMGDILAKRSVRRTSQRRPSGPSGQASVRHANGGHANAGRANIGPAGGATGRAKVERAAGGPADNGSGDARPAMRDATRPLAEADIRETPPGMSAGGREGPGGPQPADVRAGAADDDRILELSPRQVARGPVRLSTLVAPFAAAQPRRGPDNAVTQAGRTPERGDVATGGVREAATEYAPGLATAAPHTRRQSVRANPAGDAVCPHCGGAGFVRLDLPLGDPAFGKPVPCVCKERQLEERRRSDLRRWSSLDPFREKTFEHFDSRIQGLGEAYEVARAFAHDPDGWLVLSGPHGVGKTHLAAAVANWQLAQGTPVFFSIVPDLLDHLRAAFAPASDVPYDEMFDKVREAGLLVLDDLGAENSTAWATEKLYQLMNYRYNFRMPTVITTNARLLTQMDDRLRSRLADIDLARHVAIKAQDYREHRTRRQASGRGERPAAGEPTGRRGFGG
ncbi:MAG TPA: ATP-binding protein [Ktedonobacterales bacterium]